VDWGWRRSSGRRRVCVPDRRPHLLRLRDQANTDWKASLDRMAAVRGLPAAAALEHRHHLARVPALARADGLIELVRGKKVMLGAIDGPTTVETPRRSPTRCAALAFVDADSSSRAPTAGWRPSRGRRTASSAR
jgi:hypothetical protein